jgi:chemotaxis-related protein WspD
MNQQLSQTESALAGSIERNGSELVSESPDLSVTPSAREDPESFFDRQPPPRYLEEWVQRLAQPEEQVAQDLESVVIFRLADEYLAVATRSLVEVTLPQSVHAIPHRSNEVVLGLVNIRGQLRICVSAHGLLGVAAPTTASPPVHAALAKQRMLIVRERLEQWVFPVEEVVGVHRLSTTDLKPVPATFGKGGAFSVAVFVWDGHTVGFLDEGRFISALRSASK